MSLKMTFWLLNDMEPYTKLKTDPAAIQLPVRWRRPAGTYWPGTAGAFRCLPVILFFLLLSLHHAAGAGEAGSPFSDSRFTIVDGVRVHYRESGPYGEESRGSVLLVHGFAGSTFSWRYVTDTLVALGFHVVAVDMPPYGYSDKNPSINQSFTARAYSINLFLEQVFPGREWHVVGHSMGGGVTQALAIMYPDRIRSATLVDGTLFSSLSTGEYATPWIIRGGMRREMALIFMRPLLVNRLMVKRLLTSAYGRSPARDEVTGYLVPLKIRGTARAILNAPVASTELMAISTDSLKLPILVIWGDQDKWVPADAFKEVVEKMDGARMVYVHGAAHCPMETHPVEFNALLAGFLLEVTANDSAIR